MEYHQNPKQYLDHVLNGLHINLVFNEQQLMCLAFTDEQTVCSLTGDELDDRAAGLLADQLGKSGEST